MKKLSYLLFVTIVVASMSMTSCSKNYYVAGGSVPKKVLKNRKVYKTEYASDYTIKAYDVLRSYQITSFDAKNVAVGKDSINAIYNELFLLFDEYLSKEYDKLTQKMGKTFLLNGRNFVLIKTKPWKIMPKSSMELANQFDFFITAVMTEVNKNSTKTFSKNIAFNGPAFRASFIHNAITAFLSEYTEKSKNPMIMKKRKK